MFPSIVVKVSIQRPFAQVYDFLADPVNFARWASVPGTDVEPMGGTDWLVEVPSGQLIIRFAPRNGFGVLDFQGFPPGQNEGPVTPVRLHANGDGAELLYVCLQMPGVSDEKFRSEVEWLKSDLQRLKALVESL